MLYILKKGDDIQEFENFLDFVKNYDRSYQMRCAVSPLAETHKFKREAVMAAVEKEFKTELAWLDKPYAKKPAMTRNLGERISLLRDFLYELPTNYLNGDAELQYRWSLICYICGYVLKNATREAFAA